MPYKDPKLLENIKPADQFANKILAEHLELLNHIGKNISQPGVLLADGGKPKVAPSKTDTRNPYVP